MAHAIKIKHIAAALLTAANGGTRPGIVGVAIHGNLVIGTDGACLSVFNGPYCDGYVRDFTMPLEIAKQVADLKQDVAYVCECPDGTLRIDDIVFEPIAVQFPAWRKVIRTPVTEGTNAPISQFSPVLLNNFLEIAKLYGRGLFDMVVAYADDQDDKGRYLRCRVGINGLENEFIGVIMGYTPESDIQFGDLDNWDLI